MHVIHRRKQPVSQQARSKHVGQEIFQLHKRHTAGLHVGFSAMSQSAREIRLATPLLGLEGSYTFDTVYDTPFSDEFHRNNTPIPLGVASSTSSITLRQVMIQRVVSCLVLPAMPATKTNENGCIQIQVLQQIHPQHSVLCPQPNIADGLH